MGQFRKIFNKERAGCRGPKMRYNVWRAKHNEYWEAVNKLAVEAACEYHGLNIDDVKVEDRRLTWEKTLNKLEAEYQEQGKRFRTKSWQWLMNQINDEEYYGKKKK